MKPGGARQAGCLAWLDAQHDSRPAQPGTSEQSGLSCRAIFVIKKHVCRKCRYAPGKKERPPSYCSLADILITAYEITKMHKSH